MFRAIFGFSENGIIIGHWLYLSIQADFGVVKEHAIPSFQILQNQLEPTNKNKVSDRRLCRFLNIKIWPEKWSKFIGLGRWKAGDFSFPTTPISGQTDNYWTCSGPCFYFQKTTESSVIVFNVYIKMSSRLIFLLAGSSWFQRHWKVDDHSVATTLKSDQTDQ